MHTTLSLASFSLLLVACSGESEPTDTNTPADTSEPTPDLSCPQGSHLGLETSTGCITGSDVGNLEQWIGIPYAEPPLGDLRWARTVPIAPWTEPLDADEFGEICPQWDSSGLTPSLEGDEDCLSLNIFRPDGTQADDALPILFFTHGGAYTAGAGSIDLYALEPQLAERAIVVTHNYRLGAFGFLAHEDITEEDGAGYGGVGSSGNQGLFDSLAALQWVVDNAAVMGGDPSRILFFGESAGGTTTCAFLASPLAEGLFSSALIQSVGCGFLEWPLRDISGGEYTYSAEDYGEYIASELGCFGSSTLECLRELPAEDIMETLALYSFSANFDQVFLTRPAREAFSAGDFNHVPIIAGFNENEGVMFSGGMGIETEADLLAELDNFAIANDLGDAAVFAEMYTTQAFGTPQQAFDAFYGDLYFSCPTRSFLEAVSAHVETRAYFFSEAPDWLQYYEGYEEWGAFHSAELAFIFGTNPEYYSATELALSETMQAAWVTTLDSPSVDGIDAWPLFNEGGGVSGNGGTFVQFEAGATGVSAGVFRDRCDALEARGWQVY
jgi:para-nitrobenzyl esterase